MKTNLDKCRQIRITKRKLKDQLFYSSFVGNDSPIWITTELNHLILLHMIKNAISHSSAFPFILHMDRWVNRVKKTNYQSGTSLTTFASGQPASLLYLKGQDYRD
jgi:hypothetical protein